ncbi:unnamed protein product [Cyprideis torosa]|uniref:Beta-1,4-N-acetylgalactosaminyltransferase n=1 Tax=Cyprideis torosa TaxID=163714 RepID=A0A7R8ZMY4_9CRUS|nr:unnamed protein product [Cyprideis torosa]CAG0890177.1 unnamed protein product [Cyprideis torosa]
MRRFLRGRLSFRCFIYLAICSVIGNYFLFRFFNQDFSAVVCKMEKASSRVRGACPLIPPGLQGRIQDLNLKPLEWNQLESSYSSLSPGGSWEPEHCKARFKVGVLVPFRDREEHLKVFLNNLHPLLMKQELAYTIFVVEDAASHPHQFNRAALFNAGFLEANALSGPYDCFVFHDVDLIPENDHILYSCPTEQPRHLSVAVSTLNYRLPYKELFGGVCAIMTHHFTLVNGFSNRFLGWGGEDDDLYTRLRAHNLTISRHPLSVGRYTMLPHRKAKPNPERFRLLNTSLPRHEKDGLSSIKYDVLSVQRKPLFTLFKVQIHSPANPASTIIHSNQTVNNN